MKDPKIPASFLRQSATPIDNTSIIYGPSPCRCAICVTDVPLGGGIMCNIPLDGSCDNHRFVARTHSIIHASCA